MDLLCAYDSDDDSHENASVLPTPLLHMPVASAPIVLTGSNVSKASNQLTVTSNTNHTIDVMLAQMQGPAHPFKRSIGLEPCRPGSGKFDSAFIEDWAFDQQYQSFQKNGFAIDTSSNVVLGDKLFHAQGELGLSSTERSKKKKKKTDPLQEAIEKYEADCAGNDAGIENSESSPWILVPATEPSHGQESDSSIIDSLTNLGATSVSDNLQIPVVADNVYVVEPDEEAEKWELVTERKLGFVMPPRQQRGAGVTEATSTFHGQELFDYQGRSWILPPAGVRPETEEHECFIPKKCIKKYTGHTKGVNDVHFFPRTGHLLLSASMDGKCKIWDVYGDRNVRRTYAGHSEAVRCAHFADSGLEFLSSSFDRCVRLWDLETGQAKSTFTNRKMGYDVKFRPGDNNIFLMAASDNKIYQWDVRSGSVCQEYNYHLQPCNTVTFFDQGRKFFSTSDDKKILVWEYDIPVPIKYIADPDMHSVPSVTVHPSGEYFAGQSMDNTIVVYTCGEKVRQLKKKTFSGHNNAGYACHIGFSPNGKFLISGDGHGKLFVWDWKSTKTYRQFQAHEGGPCMGAAWHPLNPSWVATCGWDGVIKLWD